MNFSNRYILEDEGHSSCISLWSPETLSDLSDDNAAYTDEPLADTEWIQKYEVLQDLAPDDNLTCITERPVSAVFRSGVWD